MVRVINTEENRTSFKRGITIVKLMVASLLVIICTGCGKKNKNQNQNQQMAYYPNEVTSETGTYANVSEEIPSNDSSLRFGRKPLGGGSDSGHSYVEKHDNELYISKASDLDSVTEMDSTPYMPSSNNSSNGNVNSSNGNSNPIIPENNGNVVDNVNGGVIVNQDSFTYMDSEGNTIIQYADGSYVAIPPFNPPVEDNTIFDYNPNVSDNVSDVPVNSGNAIAEPQPVYSGYVMRKLNYSDGDYWLSFYVDENNELRVTLDDVSMMGGASMDPNNSDILGISYDKNRAGWVYVRDNDEKSQFLDNCDNIDAQLNSQISAEKIARAEENAAALEESGIVPMLTPEN